MFIPMHQLDMTPMDSYGLGYDHSTILGEYMPPENCDRAEYDEGFADGEAEIRHTIANAHRLPEGISL